MGHLVHTADIFILPIAVLGLVLVAVSWFVADATVIMFALLAMLPAIILTWLIDHDSSNRTPPRR